MPDIISGYDEPLNPHKKKLIESIALTEETIRAAIRETDSLFKFNKHALQAEKGSDSFAPLGEFHKELCKFVQSNPKKKKLILVPRSHLKTKLVTVGYSCFKIAKNPKIRILIYSATWQVAVDIVQTIERNLSDENGRFVEVFGNFREGAPQWQNDRFRLKENDKKEPTVTASGIDNNLVGGHYDLIIFDDVVSADNITTSDQIQKVIKTYNQALDLLEPDGEVIVVGTRWHDADLYGWIMDPGNNVLPQFEIFKKEAFQGSIETDDGFELLWPGKFTRHNLWERLQSEGWSQFSAQYLNEPVPEETAIFKRQWFMHYDEADLRGKLLTKFMAVDPALSEATTADYTAMMVVGMDQWNCMWILDIVRERLNPNEVINTIFQMKEKWNLTNVAIESVAYQKALAYFLRQEMSRRGKYFHVEEVKPQNRSKEERVKGLQPLYENRKIFHNPLLKNNYFLEDELLRFPNAKHDDLVDALSYTLDIIYPAKQKKSAWSGSGKKYLY